MFKLRALLQTAVFVNVFLALSGCPQTPPPENPGTQPQGIVNCLKDVGQSAVAEAVARINTTIASGISTGAVDAVILKNLAGLALNQAPAVFACAMQYVSSKLHFDSLHAPTPEDAARQQRASDIASRYIAEHGIQFASP